MKEFKYPLLAKLIYRYANIPLSLFLIIYIFLTLAAVLNDWVYVFPLVINLIIIYILNRYYFKMYRLFPYIIKADNEKIICNDFMYKNRTVEIRMADITKVTGGIFNGSPVKPIYIYDGKNNITIGFNQHLRDYNKFLTILLSNVKQELYDDLLKKVKDNSIVGKYQAKKEKN